VCGRQTLGGKEEFAFLADALFLFDWPCLISIPSLFAEGKNRHETTMKLFSIVCVCVCVFAFAFAFDLSALCVCCVLIG
jgi:hypothetical protein